MEDIRFDTKTVVVLREGLLAWQELNVTAFLASGITAAHPDLVGEPYEDVDGVRYLPLLGRPVLVMSAEAEVLARAHGRVLARGLSPPCPPRRSTWWASPCTVRRTRWTRA